MTLVATVAAVVVCVVVSVLLLLSAGRWEHDKARRRAVDSSERVVFLLKKQRLPAVLPADRDVAMQVLNPKGQVVAATPQLAGDPPMATFLPAYGHVRAEHTLCPPAGLQHCRPVVALRVFQPDGTWLVYTATPWTPWYGARALPRLELIGSLLVIMTTAIATYRTVGRTLAPVEAIRGELAEITASALHRRVPVPAHRNELRSLAETANATLDRLDAAYRQQRKFVSDASHDLRSPMTAVRTRVEEGLMSPEETDWSQTAAAVLAGMDRMQAIVADLLALARLDAKAPFVRRPVDLAALVGEELDRRTFTGEITRDLRPGVFTDCDRLLITRLLANLLDNAERHAIAHITVVVRAEGATAILEVIDDGEGIAPELRQVVFERFTRLQASRERDTGGTGLGLAIAKEIAEAHEGVLTIEDSDRGTRFVLRLPECDPRTGQP